MKKETLEIHLLGSLVMNTGLSLMELNHKCNAVLHFNEAERSL